MMSAQGQTGSGTGGMSGQPGGWTRGTGSGEVRRGPGPVAALLAFGLLVLMAVGSVKVLRDRRGGPAETAREGSVSLVPGSLEPGLIERDADDSIEAVAVLGGRTFDGGSGEFRKADAVAIMGHCVLDLRNAQVKGDRAVIDAVAIMGHLEILVPPDWDVATGDMLTAGSVRNAARRSGVENPRRVRIDGVVLMGKVDVRR